MKTFSKESLKIQARNKNTIDSKQIFLNKKVVTCNFTSTMKKIKDKIEVKLN